MTSKLLGWLQVQKKICHALNYSKWAQHELFYLTKSSLPVTDFGSNLIQNIHMQLVTSLKIY